MTTAAQTARLPAHIFGLEPAHDWCYYFEKAELAKQEGDWQRVADLADQALSDKKKFYRRNVSELTPYIEGYARTAQWEKAVQLSLDAYNTWENMRTMVCDTWKSVTQTTQIDAQGQKAFEEIQQIVKCNFP